jgi:hypothetical protein
VGKVDSGLGDLILLTANQRKERRDSDWGRRYGWFIEGEHGQRIGTLEYIRCDWESQFWHDYEIKGLSDEDDQRRRQDFDAFWRGCTLRNRKYLSYITKDFLPAPREERMVPMRGLCVPDEFYTGAPYLQES